MLQDCICSRLVLFIWLWLCTCRQGPDEKEPEVVEVADVADIEALDLPTDNLVSYSDVDIH